MKIETVSQNELLMHALAYAEMGWRIFPVHSPVWRVSKFFCSCGKECGSPGKHPRTVQGVKEASDDQEQILEWWDIYPKANIGLATGASGVFVLDVDGDVGKNSLGLLMDEFGQLPETMEAETGGGGLHIFFRMPDEIIKNSASKLGEKLDIRGSGGYVVAAPSHHMSGKEYRWVSGWPDGTIAYAPQWLIEKIKTEPKRQDSSDLKSIDQQKYWLDSAVSQSTNGKRNAMGFWLACQMRDAKFSRNEAERVLREYVGRVPQGESPYTETEAMASVVSAYSSSAREPVEFKKEKQEVEEIKAEPVQAISSGASAELGNFFGRVVTREIYNIPWPGTVLTDYTQALLPGTVTCICSDPGMGKTFYVLQCLQFWHGAGFDPVVYFIEKDRRFHTHRLLAQLEGNSDFVKFSWIADHGDEILAALEKHKDFIDEIGKLIFSSPAERVTVDSLLGWIRQQASAGKKIIVVDPITAISAGNDRWLKDEQFIIESQQIMTAHEARLILITHAKKGNRPSNPTGHDMAGGSAYHRFTDTTIWISREKKPKDVSIQTVCGNAPMSLTTFFEIHKARNDRGSHRKIGYIFGHGLKFSEQGIVVDE